MSCMKPQLLGSIGRVVCGLPIFTYLPTLSV
jgi:hypothetical protein